MCSVRATQIKVTVRNPFNLKVNRQGETEAGTDPYCTFTWYKGSTTLEEHSTRKLTNRVREVVRGVAGQDCDGLMFGGQHNRRAVLPIYNYVRLVDNVKQEPPAIDGGEVVESLSVAMRPQPASNINPTFLGTPGKVTHDEDGWDSMSDGDFEANRAYYLGGKDLEKGPK